jgi:hypothetical protein
MRGWGRRSGEAASALWMAFAAAACVTQEIEPEAAAERSVDARTVVVPFAGRAASSAPVSAYYSDILAQMQDALQHRDLERLRELVASHDRPEAPQWVRDHIDGFAAAALGLEFELHAARHTRIELPAPTLPIGAPVQVALAVSAPPGRSVRAASTPVKFLMSVRVVDSDAYGGRSERSSSTIVEAEAAQDAPWRIPFGMDLPAGRAVVREVDIRAELLPGVISIDGTDAPVRRIAVGQAVETYYPEGVEPIRAQPLRTLERAVALGDEAHFAHEYLAARFIPEADRAAAIEILIRQVRLGTPAQVRAATAALRLLTSEEIVLGDRDAWLAWWQKQAAATDQRDAPAARK